MTQGGRSTYHRMRVVAIVAACIFGLSMGLIVCSVEASHAFVERALLTDLGGMTDVAVGRLQAGRNERRVAVAQNGRVLLCSLSENGLGVDAELEGFKNPAISVAFADFNGDGQEDLLVGSAGPGIVYVYGLSEGYPFLAQTDRYMWSPVVKLLTPDLDGDGFPDVVGLSEAGVAFAFVNRSGGLAQIWRSGSREGFIRHLLASDLCGDGKDAVIVGRDQGYVSVLRWTAGATEGTAAVPVNPLEYDGGFVDISHLSAGRRGESAPAAATKEVEVHGELESFWEEYPWGQIHFVGALDADRDGAKELVVVTSQNLLYAYSFSPSGTVTLKTSAGVPQMADSLRMALQPFQPGEGGLLLGVQGKGLALWQQRTVDTGWTFDVIWQSEFDLEFSQVVQAGKYLIFRCKDSLRVLERVPANYVQVVVRGRPYLGLQVTPIFVRGDILLAAKDWADLFGLSLTWNQGQRRMTILWGMQYLVATVGSREVVVNGRQVTLRQEPRNRDGLVFLPTELIRLLTPEVSWQPHTRLLTIR